MLGNSATLKVFSSWSLELHVVMFSPEYICMQLSKNTVWNIRILFFFFSPFPDIQIVVSVKSKITAVEYFHLQSPPLPPKLKLCPV